MNPVNLDGAWTLARTGTVRTATDVPSSWRAAYRADRLVVNADGSFTRSIGAGTRKGAWHREGDVLVMQEQGFDPVRAVLRDGAIHWVEADEEHGGFIVLAYAPEAAFSLADAEAKLKKTKDKAKLVAREGWVQRALREGDGELLALCLRNKAGIYPETLRDLNASPEGSLATTLAALFADPSARASLAIFLADAAPAVARAAVALPDGAALAGDVALTMASSPNGRSAESFAVFAAASPTVDVRDRAGVPLLFHVVLRGPAAWVPVVLPRADRTATLAQPARVGGDWGSLELPPGADVRAAAALCAAALEAVPNPQAWHVAALAELRARAALVAG